ncbi:MAG: hypothetical protein JW923_08690 [Spirochaetales bacterium]|nr:hypothetical protein [Spirochaetales bacterium]
MNKTEVRLLAGALALVLALASCVSTGASRSSAPPDWALRTPAPDSTYTYFVGHAAVKDGNVSLALDDATANLVSSIMTYMGVKVTAESTAVAKASLDSYQADIVQTVKAESAGRIAGFQIKERTEVKEKSGAVTLYILASYVTTDLNKEKVRIAALFKEQEDAVSKPEAAGDAAVASGRVFDAVKSYVEAAVAASSGTVDNADIKLERNINKARTVLGKVRFERLDSPTSVSMGKAYAKPFSARLVYGEGSAAPGIPGAEVSMVYQYRNTNGRILTRTERGLTDAKGVISFAPPEPNFVGKASFVFRLNLDSTRDLMDRIPAKYDGYVTALDEDLSTRTLSFDYVIASDARTVPTGVYVVDVGADGAASPTSVAEKGLFDSMAKERFKVGLAPIDPALVLSGNTSAIVAQAKARYSPALSRFIFGSARVEGAVKDGSMWQATARMSVTCVDLATGMVLYATEKVFVAVAADEAGARSAALMQVAREAVAKDLMSSLP